MSVSFCLARANRPGLHTDRQAHLQGSQFLLSSVPDRQLIADLQHNDDLDAGTSSSTAAGGVTAQLELVAEGYRLYLGGQCCCPCRINCIDSCVCIVCFPPNTFPVLHLSVRIHQLFPAAGDCSSSISFASSTEQRHHMLQFAWSPMWLAYSQRTQL
jgi:hypothetical protein